MLVVLATMQTPPSLPLKRAVRVAPPCWTLLLPLGRMHCAAVASTCDITRPQPPRARAHVSATHTSDHAAQDHACGSAMRCSTRVKHSALGANVVARRQVHGGMPSR